MKAKAIQKSIDFLVYKDLGEVDFSFSSTYKGISLGIDFDNLSKEELTNLKRVFGPLKPEVSQYSSELVGERKLTEDFTMKMRISSAFKCKELAASDLTEAKLDRLAENIRAGTIKVLDCEPKHIEIPVEDLEDLRHRDEEVPRV